MLLAVKVEILGCCWARARPKAGVLDGTRVGGCRDSSTNWSSPPTLALYRYAMIVVF